RSLAGKLHPDKNPGDTEAEKRFKAVNRAHQVLSDPQKRRLYDEFGEDGLREGFDADAARAYRSATAGGGQRFRYGQPQKLEDLFGGGGGGLGDLFGDLFSSQGGPGAGRVRMKGGDVASEVTVDFASALRGAELHLKLHDSGKEVKVRIPKGANTGDKVRVPGHGAQGRMGGPPGDLLLSIVVQPH